MDIFVFKTNISSPEKIYEVSPHLNSLDGILKWNFDLQDTDKILRVEARNVPARSIESALNYAGYNCEELPD